MYIKIFVALLFCSTFFSCFLASKKRGSGNVTVENRAISPFNKIEVKGVFNVILKQSETEKVTVETDDNLQELVVVNVANGVLELKMKKNSNFGNTTKMNVVVYLKNIEILESSLVGKLSSDGPLKLSSLQYKSSAVGNTDLELEVANLNMNISAVGKTTFKGVAINCSFKNTAVGGFDGGNFFVENMKLDNSAVGNTILNAKNLDSKNNAVGKTSNKYKNTGTGNLEGE